MSYELLFWLFVGIVFCGWVFYQLTTKRHYTKVGGGFSVKVPLHVRLIGEYRAKKLAKQKLAAELKRRETFVLVGTIIGKTTYSHDKDAPAYNTHLWECYEAPNGKRVTVFTSMAGGAKENDHRVYGLIIEWKHGLRDLVKRSDDTYWFSLIKERAS